MKEVVTGSSDVVSATLNWIQSILKIMLKFFLTAMTKTCPNLVINIIQLVLWQLNIVFEDRPINFKVLSLKAS